MNQWLVTVVLSRLCSVNPLTVPSFGTVQIPCLDNARGGFVLTFSSVFDTRRVPAVLPQRPPHRGAAHSSPHSRENSGILRWAPCSSQSSEQETLAGFMRAEGWTSMGRSFLDFVIYLEIYWVIIPRK